MTNLVSPNVNSNSTDNATTNTNQYKKTPNDFKFELLVGEGSFSTVYKAREVKNDRIYAVKTCEKKHVRKENKRDAIMREKEIMTILTNNSSPFLVRLYCTFQDEERLYFVMTYAENGELLKLLNKVGSFDEECTRFYAAEIVLALEHLHRLNIIHRDLKPENILLNSKMHILIADFGSAFINDKKQEQEQEEKQVDSQINESELEVGRPRRKNSFVGTAQYVSPEMLYHKKIGRWTDLWALGCIIYQLTSGSLAFKERTDYLIFQKIINLKYEFPDGFNSVIRDLVESFLKLNSEERLGAKDELKDKLTNENLPYKSIREHPFFKPLEGKWDNLHNEEAPKILPYLPSNSNSEELRSEFQINTDEIQPGLDGKQITRLLGLQLNDENQLPLISYPERRSIMNFSEEEKQIRLEKQRKESKWHRFVEGNLILKEGFLNKRKGLFARKRMFLLTTGPHLYYVETVNMILKGEIPWSKHLRTELKNFKIFFVHTPKRVYYLEDPEGYGTKWLEAIEDVRKFYYNE